MKRCPECRRDYYDDSLRYCLDDGSALLDRPVNGDSNTALLPELELPTEVLSCVPRWLPKSIVGRQTEITTISSLLLNDGVRLLTLTGVGGTGKTPLANIVVGELIQDFRDGVFFIELAAITDPDLVVPTIAKSLGLQEAGGRPLIEVLSKHLRDRQTLLILDNFEQVMAAASIIADLLYSSAALKILVTSRVSLPLRAGREFHVPPLAVPAEETLDDHSQSTSGLREELLCFEAVKLFVERAQEIRPGFLLTDGTLRAWRKYACASMDFPWQSSWQPRE